ncbi:MAG TPA: class II aldolase/adducin family protein [Blastocatellia bacterium]|nr:class II aldolase/adducin family protein [Blastocatellia bacterium]
MYDDLKYDLCCGARILYNSGLSAGIAGHLSIMAGPNKMIANRFGPSFATVTPEDVLTLDLDGTVLEGKGAVNDTIRLHGVIHKYNPGIVAVAHTHPPTVVTYSSLGRIPEVFDQESCFLAGDVGVVEEDFQGLAASEDRVKAFALALGHHRAVILPNHGAITKGDSIREAIITMLLLEGMVSRNLAVAAASRATGVTPRPIAPDIALATKKELDSLNALGLVWADLIAKLPPALVPLTAPGESAAQAGR